MNNKELPAETAADSSTEAEVTPSSQTIANAPVGSSLFVHSFTIEKSKTNPGCQFLVAHTPNGSFTVCGNFYDCRYLKPFNPND